MKKNNDLSVKKMFIEIRLCNRMTYAFKGHVKIIEIYMVKFNVAILKRLRIMVFLVNIKYIHKYNVILNKTVTKLVTILTKCFFSYLNPTSYLKKETLAQMFFCEFCAIFKNIFFHRTPPVAGSGIYTNRDFLF